MIPELHEVLDPGHLRDLARRDTDELRALRTRCSELENALSYVRRLAQGRLDVVAAEAERRRRGERGDLGSLVAELPDILAGGVRGVGSGRVAEQLEPPGALVTPLTAELDAVAPATRLGELPELGDDAVTALLDELRRHEERLSGWRRRLHELIDTLNDELARRYAGGEPVPNA
ncbi:MAG: hypothetical protein D6683_00820 [Actinomyces sp.]|nr:MAG: hypothetical protein D6683_00820 [Actinomyces sp.]